MKKILGDSHCHTFRRQYRGSGHSFCTEISDICSADDFVVSTEAFVDNHEKYNECEERKADMNLWSYILSMVETEIFESIEPPFQSVHPEPRFQSVHPHL